MIPDCKLKNKYYPFFEMLGTELRIDIIRALKRYGPLNVTQICNILNQEQSKISHNLRKMAGCSILTVKKEGNFRYYSLNKKTILPILKIIDEHVKIYCERCNYDRKAGN